MKKKLITKKRAIEKKKPAEKKPAEKGGVAGSLALLACYLLGVDDPGVLVALGVVFGAVPYAITWCVDRYVEARQRSESGYSLTEILGAVLILILIIVVLDRFLLR